MHELACVHISAMHLDSLLSRQEGLNTDWQVVDSLWNHSEDFLILSPREVDQLRVARMNSNRSGIFCWQAQVLLDLKTSLYLCID